ncbi:MAG: flagellar basal body L-ring protein FlgH [Alphaproteobacteria bacterium]|nr:flagellar basal body L-ring protein FlgH [Alphaproteobacteria bacterium]
MKIANPHRGSRALSGGRLAVLIGCGCALAGCNTATRLSQIGEMPPLTEIQNPQLEPGYRPVSLPMPNPIPGEHRPSSLWQAGTRAFFKDQRASQIGDILTVVVNIADTAKLDNSTSRTRNNAENAAMPNMLGLEKLTNKWVTAATSGANGQLVNATSQGSSAGTGNIQRDETVSIRVAALVTQTLPNGNLVVRGKQEMRVNYEVRDLQIAGVVRPLDISATNEVTLDKLAEARVDYGGRGQITDVQQPRWGQQLYDAIFPF